MLCAGHRAFRGEAVLASGRIACGGGRRFRLCRAARSSWQHVEPGRSLGRGEALCPGCCAGCMPAATTADLRPRQPRGAATWRQVRRKATFRSGAGLLCSIAGHALQGADQALALSSSRRQAGYAQPPGWGRVPALHRGHRLHAGTLRGPGRDCAQCWASSNHHHVRIKLDGLAAPKRDCRQAHDAIRCSFTLRGVDLALTG